MPRYVQATGTAGGLGVEQIRPELTTLGSPRYGLYKPASAQYEIEVPDSCERKARIYHYDFSVSQTVQVSSSFIESRSTVDEISQLGFRECSVNSRVIQ